MTKTIPTVLSTSLPTDSFVGVVVKRMNLLIETANKSNAWEMEAVAEIIKAVHLLNSDAKPADEIATIRGYVKNARGAIESGQVTDKDVHGTLTKVIAMLDALPAALAATPALSGGRIPLADHDEIGRKVLGQPWAIQSAIITIAAHCTVLVDKCPTGDVADLAGCISEACLQLANALAAQPASPLRGREALIEQCAKIAEPWSGFIDADKMGAADNAVIKVRNDIAAAIRSLKETQA